jgi:hypothetical protein
MSDSENQEARQFKDALDEILRRIDSLPILDSRLEDEIIGYDEHGLPE